MGGNRGAKTCHLHPVAGKNRIHFLKQLLDIFRGGCIEYRHFMHPWKILDEGKETFNRLGPCACALIGDDFALIEDHQGLDALHRTKDRPCDGQAATRLQMLHRINKKDDVGMADHRVDEPTDLVGV